MLLGPWRLCKQCCGALLVAGRPDMDCSHRVVDLLVHRCATMVPDDVCRAMFDPMWKARLSPVVAEYTDIETGRPIDVVRYDRLWR